MFKRFLVKKALSFVLTLMLVMTIVVGCDKKTETSTKDQPKQTEENKTHTITDMAGRKLTIPKEVKKVYSTSAVGTIAVYTINPSKLAGKNSESSEIEKKYTTKEYQDLPNLGKLDKGGSGNEEEILKEKPDIIISMGNIDDEWNTFADEEQKKIGVPILMVDGDIQNLDKSYEFLGDILGEEARAKELAEYCKKTIDETKEIASKIPQDKKVKVYYAQGADGLQTNIAGSLHAQTIELVGGINATDVQVEKMSSSVDVSMEQVLKWNPDKIIVGKDKKGKDSAYDEILKGGKWNGIKAAKEGKVYEIPTIPFNWFDRPPSVNRIIGVKWLGNLLYPEEFKIDIKEETKDFYNKFYHRELTDDEAEEILQNAIAK